MGVSLSPSLSLSLSLFGVFFSLFSLSHLLGIDWTGCEDPRTPLRQYLLHMWSLRHHITTHSGRTLRLHTRLDLWRKAVTRVNKGKKWATRFHTHTHLHACMYNRRYSLFLFLSSHSHCPHWSTTERHIYSEWTLLRESDMIDGEKWEQHDQVKKRLNQPTSHSPSYYHLCPLSAADWLLPLPLAPSSFASRFTPPTEVDQRMKEVQRRMEVEVSVRGSEVQTFYHRHKWRPSPCLMSGVVTVRADSACFQPKLEKKGIIGTFLTLLQSSAICHRGYMCAIFKETWG